MTRTILILGGTADAVCLAQALSGQTDLRVVYSLAGRTANPRLPPVEVRHGGFGGVDGLVGFLTENHVTAVVDCTHPFAARMGQNAVQACAMTGTPLLRLERPAWAAAPGDRWDMVDDWPQATEMLRAKGAGRVLLAVGRQELQAFAGMPDLWFLIRSVEYPDSVPEFPQGQWLLARGPFSLADELDLLREQRIDTIICKNSGGPTDAKLAAARELGVRVIMRSRPRRPDILNAGSVDAALDWLRQR